MGVVYRARDGRLGRDVAIKLVPEEFSNDPDRRKRFEQEARAASALNHPNILTVFDIGTENGRLFVVMELLEGKTFRQVIAEGKLPVRKVLAYAEQIALGMAAAHEYGIIHRDLKPENIFLTRDGRIKILDFGLAKLSAGNESGETREALTVTRPGVVVGTAGYMSPEQVRSEALDARSDIFSFGAVLYELCAGKPAFDGGTGVEIMSAILRTDPPPVTQSSPDAPPPLDDLVRRCLEKRREDRFQSARDLAFTLGSLQHTSSQRTSGADSKPPIARRRLLPWLAGVPLAASWAGAYYFGRSATGRRGGEFRRLTFRRGYVPTARFSPDGQTIIYSAAWGAEDVRLYSGRRDRPEYRALDLPAAYILAISSLGEMALLSSQRPKMPMEREGTLSVAPLAGGSPRELVRNVQSADWTPDGKELAVVRPFQRYRLEWPVGKMLYETEGKIADPRVSPDGMHVAYVDQPQYGDDAGFVAIADRSGKRQRLSRDWRSCQGLAWSPKGDEVIFTAASKAGGRQLYAVSLNGQERTLAEEADRLLLHDVSRDGELLLTHESYRYGIFGSLADGQGERDLSWLDAGLLNDMSRDGKAVLFAEGGAAVGGNPLVYLRRAQDPQPVQLGTGRFPAVAPNMQWVACLADWEAAQILLLPVGAGDSRRLPTGPLSRIEYVRWLPDSRRLLVSGAEKGKPRRIYVQDIDGGLPHPISADGVALCAAALAPDGRHCVGCANGKGYLIPVEGGAPITIAGWKTGEELIAFSPDGSSAYVQLLDTVPARVERLELATGKRSPWKTFLPVNSAGITAIGPIAMTPDLRCFAYNCESVISELYVLGGAL